MTDTSKYNDRRIHNGERRCHQSRDKTILSITGSAQHAEAQSRRKQDNPTPVIIWCQAIVIEQEGKSMLLNCDFYTQPYNFLLFL